MIELVIPERSTPCSGLTDPDIFFDGEHAAEAKRLCSRCWFKAQCIEIGRDEKYGIWGGVMKRVSRGVNHDLIRELAADLDMSLKDIAEIANCSYSTAKLVASQVRDCDIGKKQSAERKERDAKIGRLYDQGMSWKQIAEHLSMSPETVRRALHRERPGWSDKPWRVTVIDGAA